MCDPLRPRPLRAPSPPTARTTFERADLDALAVYLHRATCTTATPHVALVCAGRTAPFRKRVLIRPLGQAPVDVPDDVELAVVAVSAPATVRARRAAPIPDEGHLRKASRHDDSQPDDSQPDDPVGEPSTDRSPTAILSADGWVVHLVSATGDRSTRWWGAEALTAEALTTLAGAVDDWCVAVLATARPATPAQH